MAEYPHIVVSSGDRLITREITSEEKENQLNTWGVSSPIPGMAIIAVRQVYLGIWLALVKAENGHYQIFQSIDRKKFSLVWDHPTEIYGWLWLDDGFMIFSAEDGRWVTRNTGLSWEDADAPNMGEIVPEQEIWVEVPNEVVPEYDSWEDVPLLEGDAPPAKAMAAIGLTSSTRALVVYANDGKIYYTEFPYTNWEEACDTAEIQTGRWLPAVAGGPAGLLAGAGNKLLRSTQAGAPGSWHTALDLGDRGIIKSIVVSDQTTLPIFCIVIEAGDADKIYWTHDLGDSIEPDVNRITAGAAVKAVYPTGQNEKNTLFAIVGEKTSTRSMKYDIFEA